MRTVGLKVNVCPGTLVLVVAEVAVFVGILLIGTTYLSLDGRSLIDDATSGRAAVAAGLFIFTMWLLGAYDRRFATSLPRNGGRLVIACLIISMTFWLVASIHSNPTKTLAPSLVTSFLVVLCAFAGVVVVRAAFGGSHVLTKSAKRILVLGVGDHAAKIEALARCDGTPSFTIAGFVRGSNETVELKASNFLAANESIPQLAARLNVGEIVVALAEPSTFPLEPLWECRLRGLKVTDHLTFCEREAGTLMLDSLDPGWLVYSEGFELGPTQKLAKRLFDIVISCSFLIFVLPMVAAMIIAIRLDSRGPIFHRQVRVGLNGVPFEMYKFRSMHVDAERDGIARWAAHGDKRITRVGSIMRRLHIDEIPQAVNVLRGDMSFIGPRPERPSFVEQLNAEIPYYAERHRVRPGITGWAQVNYQYGASVEDARQKLAYDLYYIKNYSIGLDLVVLLRTVQAVLWPVGVR